MKDMDMRILEMLKDCTIENARTAAYILHKDIDSPFYEDAINRYNALTAAIDRCGSNQGTYEDWKLLTEEIEL